MHDARPIVTTEPAGHRCLPHALAAEPRGEPMDPNEIRIALDDLRHSLSRIRSVPIRRHLRTAYERIARITVIERLPQSLADQAGPVSCRR